MKQLKHGSHTRTLWREETWRQSLGGGGGGGGRVSEMEDVNLQVKHNIIISYGWEHVCTFLSAAVKLLDLGCVSHHGVCDCIATYTPLVTL